MARSNEGKCCDAVVRYLEERASDKRQRVRWPEADGHKAPVELACEIAGALYALEHTMLEPFAGQIKSDLDRSKLLDPIIERVKGKLPDEDHFELLVSVELTQGLKTKEFTRIQDVLVAWIIETAPKLEVAPFGRWITPILNVALPEVPFKVSLHRSDSDGVRHGFTYITLVPDDREAALASRVAKACDDKLGKLGIWKHSEGARSVLVLEQNHLPLSNPAKVGQALREILATRDRTLAPDEVYHVGTYVDAWTVICLLRDGIPWPDQLFRQYYPADLVSVTKR